MKKVITCDDIMGKKTVDPEGCILGTVVKLHIDTSNNTIVGITVDMGLMKPDLFIGMEFIDHFGVDAVLLSRVPTDRFKGLTVMTAEGVVVGIVKKVLIERKNIREIIVSTKEGLFTKGSINIPSKAIAKIGASIILKKDYKLQNNYQT